MIPENSFEHYSDLEKRADSSLQGKRFTGKMSDMVFEEYVDVKIHQKNIHLREKRFMCEMCDKAFGQSSSLKRPKNSSDSDAIYKDEFERLQAELNAAKATKPLLNKEVAI